MEGDNRVAIGSLMKSIIKSIRVYYSNLLPFQRRVIDLRR